MRIHELKKGQKYYHTIATNFQNKETGVKVRETRKVFVLEVDKQKRKVCASINGAPAQWFEGAAFSRWTKEDPTQPKTKLLTRKEKVKKVK